MRRSLSRRTVVLGAAAAALAGAGRAAAQSTPAATPAASPVSTPPVNLSENERKAVAVLESLESGDPAAVEAYVSADAYVQHNLAFADGRQTLLDALPSLKTAGTTVDVRRVIEDGDFVALHSAYTLFGGPMVGFDVFRFDDGLIVEHWDNLQETATNTVSGRGMIDGPTEIADLDRTEANKALVRGFVEDVLMGNAPQRIADYISAAGYAQHNPAIADDLEGLNAFIATLAEQGSTVRLDALHRVVGEGNFVLAMGEGAFAGEPTAFYDLFRVEGGKLVEHWDVIEAIPPAEEWKNENGKF